MSTSIRRVKVVSDLYINDSKQKAVLLQRKEEAKRALQNTDSETPLYTEIFTVASSMMGLAIGSHGANIAAARKIEGVDDIVLDETHSEDGHCTFKVSFLKSTYFILLFLDLRQKSRGSRAGS